MDRLTELVSTTCGRTYEPITNDRECCDKLGELEDIEEEIGIDLITLFKALKDGIYFKHHYYGIDHRQVSYITRTALVYRYSSWGDDEDIHFTYYDYNDYGKTWALTKEELK